MKNIAIFASGSGSNAENIAHFFRTHPNINISLILTNNPEAKVIQRAEKLDIECFIFNRDQFRDSNVVLNKLKEHNIDFIVLAGFLWLIPSNIIEAFPSSVINIHPALLPKYGGKGMYGSRVHEAVLENKEQVSGITIHYVNERYDEGNIIFQAQCTVEDSDGPDELAAKIHTLEYKHFPALIEKVVLAEEA